MLRSLAEQHSLAVLVTNHLVSATTGSSSSSSSTAGGTSSSSSRGGVLPVPWQVFSSSGGLMKPALGEAWRSQPHTRVVLTRGGGYTTATLTATTMTVSDAVPMC
jgi:hypothetical protein